jgi:hypothetical protein
MTDREARQQRLARRIGAAIVDSMAESHSSLKHIAGELSISEVALRRAVMRLLDGHPIPLPQVADILHVTGYELQLSLVPAQAVNAKPEPPLALPAPPPIKRRTLLR